MISKSQIKLIASLSQKKFRDELNLFVAEGTKVIEDMIDILECEYLFATTEWIGSGNKIDPNCPIRISNDDFRRISSLKNPQGILAVFKKKKSTFTLDEIKQKLSLVLDDIQDPGNMGTILRIADWFGLEHVFCSMHCADIYGPKTVQATMGALARVKIHYVDLELFLQNIHTQVPIYGTFLDGENIYNQTLTNYGLIIMGNEGNGISEKIEKFVGQRLLIPDYPAGNSKSESLNVAIATALVCAEMRRRLT